MNPAPEDQSKSGIGVQKEGALHAALKEAYLPEGGSLEVLVEGYIVDILGPEGIVEIQTSGLSRLAAKLDALLPVYPVKVVLPIVARKWITLVDQDGVVVRRRRSPKLGKLLDMFQELTGLARFVTQDGFTLEVAFVDVEEFRCDDGAGSWRRGGVSIRDRKLLDVAGVEVFGCAEDYSRLLPTIMPDPFTNRDLSRELKIPMRLSGRMIYALRVMGVLRVAGRIRQGILYERVEPRLP